MRGVIAIGLALVLSGCVREPKEAELLQALRRYHQDWVSMQRRQHAEGEPLAPLVNLSFEAGLTLHIQSVIKHRCRPAHDAMGFMCSVEVIASTPYTLGVHRRIEARFVEGLRGWIAVAPRPIES